MNIDLEIVDAWNAAAADLGIRVVAPVLVILRDGSTRKFEAHVLDFGGRAGALAMSERSRVPFELMSDGQWCSVLGSSYRLYARDLFSETLDDWQWYGEQGGQPIWYKGKPWSK